MLTAEEQRIRDLKDDILLLISEMAGRLENRLLYISDKHLRRTLKRMLRFMKRIEKKLT